MGGMIDQIRQHFNQALSRATDFWQDKKRNGLHFTSFHFIIVQRLPEVSRFRVATLVHNFRSILDYK